MQRCTAPPCFHMFPGRSASPTANMQLGSNPNNGRVRAFCFLPHSCRGSMRSAFAVFLAVTLSLYQFAGAEPMNEVGAWLATVRIIQKGGSTSGVYLESDLIITAAHVINPNSDVSVEVSGITLPGKVRRQGSMEGGDLSFFSFDKKSFR